MRECVLGVLLVEIYPTDNSIKSQSSLFTFTSWTWNPAIRSIPEIEGTVSTSFCLARHRYCWPLNKRTKDISLHRVAWSHRTDQPPSRPASSSIEQDPNIPIPNRPSRSPDSSLWRTHSPPRMQPRPHKPVRRIQQLGASTTASIQAPSPAPTTTTARSTRTASRNDTQLYRINTSAAPSTDPTIYNDAVASRASHFLQSVPTVPVFGLPINDGRGPAPLSPYHTV
jgi:hypothetical protein